MNFKTQKINKKTSVKKIKPFIKEMLLEYLNHLVFLFCCHGKFDNLTPCRLKNYFVAFARDYKMPIISPYYHITTPTTFFLKMFCF